MIFFRFTGIYIYIYRERERERERERRERKRDEGKEQEFFRVGEEGLKYLGGEIKQFNIVSDHV